MIMTKTWWWLVRLVRLERRETGRSDEAAKMEARAEAIRAKHAKENPAN